MIVLARLASAPTVAVERLDGFQFPALVVAVLFSRRLVVAHGLHGAGTTDPSANWAPGVCFVAAFAVGTHSRRTSQLSSWAPPGGATGASGGGAGPASLGAALRYGRRAPAAAWRWSTPALAPRPRRAIPRSRLLGRERDSPPAARARGRRRDRRRLRDLSSRELDIPPYGLIHESLVVSHASHTLRQQSHGCVSLRSDHRCSQLAEGTDLHALCEEQSSQLAAVRH